MIDELGGEVYILRTLYRQYKVHACNICDGHYA